MKRNSALKVLNPIIGLLVLNQAATALLSEMLPRDVFEVLHEGGGLVLILAALLHVILNWNWVKANYFKRSAAQG